jgi:hypothetical protein
MTVRAAASVDAMGRSEVSGDLVSLRRVDVRTFRRGSEARARARTARSRVGALIAVNLLVAVSVPGTAFAPASAHGRTDEGVSRVQVSLPMAEPAADAFELRILFDNEPIGGELRSLIEQAERERKSALARDPNEVLRFGGIAIRRYLVETILRAAEATGVDPVYMMALADKESSFLMDVKASTSSAEGLFQFVAKTWLQMVREFGPKYGLDAEAAAIEMVGGQPLIGDAALRQRVLGMRRDPYLSALMAAELLKRDRAAIEQRLGRDLKSTEYYLAHFFGAESARRFLELVGQKPKQNATHAFRAAAEANRSLFYARQGRRMRGLSVAEVYGRIDRMIDSRIDRYRGVTTVAAASADDQARAGEPGPPAI